MSSGGKKRRCGTAVLAVCALLLAACDQDENSFRSLGVTATATGPGADTPVVPATKVMVVGDAASPVLADRLESMGFDVTDVPFDTGFQADEVDMAGDYIVWVDNRNGGLDIYGYQISTATEFPISTDGGIQRSPRIAGDYVVWEDYRNDNADIYAYRFSTAKSFAVTTAQQNQTHPQIDGDYVVWQDNRNGNADIYAYQLSTGTELALVTDAGSQWYPQVAGDYVVWQSYQGGVSDIRGYRLSTAELLDISVAAGSQYSPVVSANYVAWVDNRNGSDDIYAYDLNAEQEILVSNAVNPQQRPQLAGDYVVWQDYRNGSDYDIYAYHFPSASEIPVAVFADDQTLPVIQGDLVAWQDDSPGNDEIYVYRLSTAEMSRVTNHTTAQRTPVLSADHIAWLDGRRGLTDVMFREGITGTNQLATGSWLTPAGVVDDLGDNEVVLLGSDIFSNEVMLQLFDAADAAGVGILGLGGTGTSLAASLGTAGRYAITATADSGCSPSRAIGIAPDHDVFIDVDTSVVLALESDSAETMDELAITTDAGNPDSPTSWQTLATFSTRMCNGAEPALVAFSTANGTRVLLDGSAGVADNYNYWSETRWNLLDGELNYLAGG